MDSSAILMHKQPMNHTGTWAAWAIPAQENDAMKEALLYKIGMSLSKAS